MSTFLNKPITEEQVTKLVAHLHIDNFKKVVPVYEENGLKGLSRKGEQDFIRKGNDNNWLLEYGSKDFNRYYFEYAVGYFATITE